MIVSTQIVSTLIKATDKAQQGQSDSDLGIPPVLVPVLQGQLPLDVSADSATRRTGSFIANTSLNQTGVAIAQDAALVTIANGFWDFTFFGSDYVNFYNTPFCVQWYLSYQGFAMPIVNVQGSGGRVPVQYQYRVRLFLREDAVFKIRTVATGVGNIIDANGTLIGNRLL